MAEDFYPFIDAPTEGSADADGEQAVRYATRIAIYDDMLSTPRVLVVAPADIRSYLEEITNTVYRNMREQGGKISLMVIRELVENFIHAHFSEPVVSILDGGNTIRFADQGPGIGDKERAFEFGITSANTEQKRYIRGTGAGLPMVEQYLENAGGAISIEDNLNQGTVVTVSVDPVRVEEVRRSVSRGAVVRGSTATAIPPQSSSPYPAPVPTPAAMDGYSTGRTWPSTGVNPQMDQSAAYPMAAPPSAAPAHPSVSTPAATYQQSPHEFSTNQQSWSQAAMMPTGQDQGMRAPAAQPNSPQPFPQVSERGMLAMQYLAEKGSVGPTELSAAYGESTPTWSRELATLSSIGLVVKQGQKRILTDVGRMWIQQQRQRR